MVQTMTAVAVEYDPIRDKTYRRARLGPDVAAFLAWFELGGASPISVDNYERALSVVCRMYPLMTLHTEPIIHRGSRRLADSNRCSRSERRLHVNRAGRLTTRGSGGAATEAGVTPGEPQRVAPQPVVGGQCYVHVTLDRGRDHTASGPAPTSWRSLSVVPSSPPPLRPHSPLLSLRMVRLCAC
jgi:hypothetical protein